MFDRQINRRFDQYVAEDEGEEDDTRNKMTDLTEEFEALVVKVEGTDAAEESDVFVTEARHPIEQAQATDIVRKLSDKAVTHALLKDNDLYNHANECFVTDRYRPGEFHGVIINTGAAGKSTAGYNQYTTYEKLFEETPINTGQERAVKAMFGIGLTTVELGVLQVQRNCIGWGFNDLYCDVVSRSYSTEYYFYNCVCVRAR
jgi:hypothetical protein